MRINKSELKKAGLALGLATTLWTYAGNQWKTADTHFNTPQLEQAEDLHYKASRLERDILTHAISARTNMRTSTLSHMIVKDLGRAQAMHNEADALVPRATYDTQRGKYLSNVVMGGLTYLSAMGLGLASGLFAVSGIAGRNRYDRIFEKKKEPKSTQYHS